jgi:outer membrane lipoprotein-sorting protein
MMNFLRTAPTRRLLAVLVSVTIGAGAAAAIALAATAGGPVPKPSSLAAAIHRALRAPAPEGISADITFTNHLIDASSLQTSDPLLLGASGRLWVSPAEHALRLELQSDNGDAQVLIHGRSFWVSDPSQNTVYEGTLPRGAGMGGPSSGKGDSGTSASRWAQNGGQIPSIAKIKSLLGMLARHLDLSGAIPSDTGGQPTYTVRVSPRHAAGLLGAVQLAFDASRGVPLGFAIYASGDANPVLALQATSVSFGPVAPSVFAISPPAGAKVVRISPPAQQGVSRHGRVLHGLSAVRAALSFPLLAPARLDGLARRNVSALSFGKRSGALVTYGEGLGAIAVIESPAASGPGLGSVFAGGSAGGVPLPSVSIDGSRGRELDTALGTVISFSRGGVRYTVLGSVPPGAALAAARGL